MIGAHIAAELADMVTFAMAPDDPRSMVEQRKYPHDVLGDWFSGPF